MPWYHLEKTIYKHQQENIYPNRNYFDRNRLTLKQKRKRLWSLFNTVIFLSFLIFSIRIGSMTLFLLQREDFNGLSMELPTGRGEKPVIKSNLKIKIFIDMGHNIVVNDVWCRNYDSFAYIMYNMNTTDPYAVPLIYADKRAKMEIILYVLDVLKIAGFKKTYFMLNSPEML